MKAFDEQKNAYTIVVYWQRKQDPHNSSHHHFTNHHIRNTTGHGIMEFTKVHHLVTVSISKWEN